jgi:hypothetical protein
VKPCKKFNWQRSIRPLAEEETKQRSLAAQLRRKPKRALQLLDELDGLGV